MAAATVLEVYSDNSMPAFEVARLTASDGETFKSRKFATIFGVWACINSNDDRYINATWSGDQVTINAANASGTGMTDKTVSLLIYGQ